jgi:membrane protease YdiL (CAAX protease family)
MFALGVASTLVGALIEPGRFHLTFHAWRWVLTLPLIAAITGLQTTTEELLFRGYLLLALGLLTQRTWLMVAINTVLFGVPHLLNPELSAGSALLAANYFLFGAFFALLTLRDNRLELAIGAHAANNLFATLVVNHENSSLPTQAIWQAGEYNPGFSLVSSLVAALLFYWLTVARRSGRSGR